MSQRAQKFHDFAKKRWSWMDFVHGLLRLAAQQQDIKAQNGLERRPNYALFAHKTHYTKKLTFCNRFFALIFYISYRQNSSARQANWQ
jgi:hypothetical protein